MSHVKDVLHIPERLLRPDVTFSILIHFPIVLTPFTSKTYIIDISDTTLIVYVLTSWYETIHNSLAETKSCLLTSISIRTTLSVVRSTFIVTAQHTLSPSRP